jgi:hypothetical protein
MGSIILTFYPLLYRFMGFIILILHFPAICYNIYDRTTTGHHSTEHQDYDASTLDCYNSATTTMHHATQ